MKKILLHSGVLFFSYVMSFEVSPEVRLQVLNEKIHSYEASKLSEAERLLLKLPISCFAIKNEVKSFAYYQSLYNSASGFLEFHKDKNTLQKVVKSIPVLDIIEALTIIEEYIRFRTAREILVTRETGHSYTPFVKLKKDSRKPLKR